MSCTNVVFVGILLGLCAEALAYERPFRFSDHGVGYRNPFGNPFRGHRWARPGSNRVEQWLPAVPTPLDRLETEPTAVGVLDGRGHEGATPCQTTPQWEGSASEWDHIQGVNNRYNISFDGNGRRKRIMEDKHAQLPGKRIYEYIMLYDEGIQYVINHNYNTCTVEKLGSWRNHTIPPNATLEGFYEIGAPGNGFKAQEWSDRIIGRQKENWIGTFSNEGCWPISETFMDRDDEGAMVVSVSTRFFNLKAGISSMSVFTPPSYCNAPNLTEARPTHSPNRARPTLPTRARPTHQTRARPTLPTRARPTLPTRARPTLPTRALPTHPARARPTLPTRARPNLPTRALPTHPARARPTLSTRARPTYPARARPTHPARARPTLPTRAQPTRSPIRSRPNVRPPSSGGRFIAELSRSEGGRKILEQIISMGGEQSPAEIERQILYRFTSMLG